MFAAWRQGKQSTLPSIGQPPAHQLIGAAPGVCIKSTHIRVGHPPPGLNRQAVFHQRVMQRQVPRQGCTNRTGTNFKS